VVNETSAKYINDSSIQLPDIVDIAINNHPDWHRFYSLKIGAKSLSKIRPTFVHNVDNPFVNKKVFKKLGDRINEADYLCPEFDGRGGHPFLISEKVINDITNVEEDQKHLKEFLNHYKRLKITVNDEKVLANINNLEEYSKYF
jgi:CTP:molybdopterin cytidylyltransferase MocA